jgi:hypothetical protein
MNMRDPSSQDNDWPEPGIKRYPGVVRVSLILLVTGLLWSVVVFVGAQAPKLLGRSVFAPSAHHPMAPPQGR